MLAAGDRLHPEKGLDYLGENWDTLEERKIDRAINERERRVRRIVGEVITAMQAASTFDYALQLCQSTKHQVVYLSRDDKGLKDNLHALVAAGVARSSFNDSFIEPVADGFIYGFHEEYSYLLREM